MYHVDFRLPVGSEMPGRQGDLIAHQTIEFIDIQLEEWKTQYGIPYKTERITDQRYRVSFGLEQDLSFFKLSWQPKFHSTGWERIEIVDNSL